MAYQSCRPIIILIEFFLLLLECVQLRDHLELLFLQTSETALCCSFKISQDHIFGSPVSINGREWLLDTACPWPVGVHRIWPRWLLDIVDDIEPHGRVMGAIVNLQVHLVQLFLGLLLLVHKSEVIRVIHPFFLRVSLNYFLFWVI